MFLVRGNAVFAYVLILNNKEYRDCPDGNPHKDLPDDVQVARFGHLLDPPFIEGGIFTPS